MVLISSGWWGDEGVNNKYQISSLYAWVDCRVTNQDREIQEEGQAEDKISFVWGVLGLVQPSGDSQ